MRHSLQSPLEVANPSRCVPPPCARLSHRSFQAGSLVRPGCGSCCSSIGQQSITGSHDSGMGAKPHLRGASWPRPSSLRVTPTLPVTEFMAAEAARASSPSMDRPSSIPASTDAGLSCRVVTWPRPTEPLGASAASAAHKEAVWLPHTWFRGWQGHRRASGLLAVASKSCPKRHSWTNSNASVYEPLAS